MPYFNGKTKGANSMRIAAAAFAALLFCIGTSKAADAPVQVMIVGTFHMSNPGLDMHNSQVDDVLQPEPQAELGRVTEALARFRPSMVAVEWPDNDITRDRFNQYLAGTLAPSRNEVVQLGFRTAKLAGLDHVDGVDVDGDFPYEPVQAYAETHGEKAILDNANAQIQSMVDKQTAMLKTDGIAATFRWINDPALIARGNEFYRAMLRIGGGTDQPGAALLTGWYDRNFKICANIIHRTKPGDRVIVFYGSGHAFLLRQCIAETPGFTLVEANAYLPK